MPIMKAAVKALRQSEKRRTVNRTIKINVKKAIKEMKALYAAKKKDEFLKKLPEVMSIIDKAAKNRMFHKNTASRKKSSLARMAAK